MTAGPVGETGRAGPSLGRSAGVMAVGTLLSRITGFGRTFALAYALGAGALAGTYVLANNTPNIIYELVLGGVLSGTLLPVFVHELTTREEDDAWRAISAVASVATVVMVALAGAFVVVAPLFIRLYTTAKSGREAADQLAVATFLLRLFAPQVACYGVISLSTAVLQARRRFAAPMFAPILNNLVVIAMFLAVPSVLRSLDLDRARDDTRGLLLLGLGTTAGVVAMTLAQLPVRTIRRHVRWVWDPGHRAVRTLVRLSGWTIGFVVANQIALFVVNRLANGTESGVAVYFNAYTFFLLPHGVVAVSIMSAVAPELAERFSTGDRRGFREQFGTGFRAIAAITIPAGVGLALLAVPLVRVLLEHGNLEPESALRIAGTLRLMALGLPAFSLYLFLTRVYQSRQDTRSLFFLYLVENGLNIVFALLLFPALGVEGLGLALALAYGGGTVAAVALLRRQAGALGGRALLQSTVRVTVATGAMAGAVALVLIASRGSASLVRSAAGLAAGGTVFLVAARLVGVRELALLLPVRRSAR